MPIDGVTTFYLTQGVLGITVLVLGIVIYLQDKRYRSDLKERDAAIALLQEKRAIEAGKYAGDFILTSKDLLTQMRDVLTIGQANQKAIETIANILMNMNK